MLIGRSTYVNRFTMFDASVSISIGAQCMIGPYCYITDHDHGVGDGPISAQALVEAPVKVGNNVWIGAHAVILKGVSIGDNASHRRRCRCNDGRRARRARGRRSGTSDRCSKTDCGRGAF